MQSSSAFGLESFELNFDRTKLWDVLYQNRPAVSIAIVVMLALYRLLFVYNQDEKEPKLITPTIPLLDMRLMCIGLVQGISLEFREYFQS